MYLLLTSPFSSVARWRKLKFHLLKCRNILNDNIIDIWNIGILTCQTINKLDNGQILKHDMMMFNDILYSFEMDGAARVLQRHR